MRLDCSSTIEWDSIRAFRAAKERVEDAPDGPDPQVVGEPNLGALPDFVIIGTQKCGTTSLYDLLVQHPHVERAALKELHYFDDNYNKYIENGIDRSSPRRSGRTDKDHHWGSSPKVLI